MLHKYGIIIYASCINNTLSVRRAAMAETRLGGHHLSYSLFTYLLFIFVSEFMEMMTGD